MQKVTKDGTHWTEVLQEGECINCNEISKSLCEGCCVDCEVRHKRNLPQMDFTRTRRKFLGVYEWTRDAKQAGMKNWDQRKKDICKICGVETMTFSGVCEPCGIG